MERRPNRMPIEDERRAFGEWGITTREILLLVVLSAMGAMAVWPFLSKGKSAAAETITMNNLVQWGIGLNLYLLEHENRLPSVGPVQPDPELKDVWYNALPPYLSQVSYGKLVSSGFKREDTSAIIWSDPAFEKMFGRAKDIFLFPYAMNRYLQPLPGQPAYAVYDVQSPRSVVFLGESASTDPGLLPGAVSYRYDRKIDSPKAKSHVLFVDGHVGISSREVLSKEQTTVAGEPMPDVSWMPFPGAPAPVVE